MLVGTIFAVLPVACKSDRNARETLRRRSQTETAELLTINEHSFDFPATQLIGDFRVRTGRVVFHANRAAILTILLESEP